MQHIPKKSHYAKCWPSNCCVIAYVSLSQKFWRALVCMNRIDINRRVDEGVTVGKCRMNRFLFADELIFDTACVDLINRVFKTQIIRFLLRATKQGPKSALESFEATCLSRRPRQCILQVSRNTLQQVQKFNQLGVVFTSDGSRNKDIHTRIGEANAVVGELYFSVVTK